MRKWFMILLFLISSIIWGDKIKLTNGQIIECTIKSVTNAYVNIETSGGNSASIERSKVDSMWYCNPLTKMYLELAYIGDYIEEEKENYIPDCINKAKYYCEEKDYDKAL